MIGPLTPLLWIALVAGFLAALIALYGRYRILPAFLTGPNICKLEAGSCQLLFRTKNAAILGVPNSLLAVLYYPLLIVGLFQDWDFVWLFVPVSAAFLMSLVLAWILLRDNLECRVCWTGHICNAVIWLVLGIRLIQGLH